MAKLGINTGSTANDGTGDTLREAGGKINTNFDEVYSTIGDGTTLFTGIVTNITAGNFISVSAATGSVTITGLANTENVNAESLVVSGVSTLGLITSSNTLGIGTIFATRLEATGAIVGNTLVGDGSQITGLATTERVVTDSLVVSGITTVGLVTGATSIGVNNLYATKLHGDGSNIVGIQYADVAGIATYAPNAGVATYAPLAGVATYASNAGVATYASLAGVATYASNAGVATYASNAGVATYAPNAGIASYAPLAGIATNANFAGYATTAGISTNATFAGYATIAGIATYAPNAGVATYAPVAGISTFATSSGVSTTLNSDSSVNTSGIITASSFVGNLTGNVTGIADTATFAITAGVVNYATNAGVATYASVAGIATYAGVSGVATVANYATNAGLSTNSTFAGYATLAGVATYADNAGIATYAPNAGIASYAPLAGLSTNSTFAGYATTAGIATYAPVAGIATYAGVSGVSTVSGYATNAGLATVATTANYATNAGLATVATTANYATNAGVATVATNAQGLTGTPDIEVGYVTVGNGLNVTGVSTLGIVTGATYYGDGGNLSNVVKTSTVQTFQNLEITGVSTLGIVTSVQSLSTNELYATDVVASSFTGDGSALTNVQTEGSVGLKLNDVYIGAGFTNIDFRHVGEQTASITSVGTTAVFTNTLLASTADTRSNTLVVTGISTLGIVTNTTAIQVVDLYATNVTSSNIYGNADGADKVLAVTDTISSSARRVSFINDIDPATSHYETVNVGNLLWTPSTGEFAGVITYMGQDVTVTGDVTANSFSGDGSGLTGVTASGTGVIVQDSGSVIGTAGTINFGDNLSVSALSGGAVTVSTASTDNVSTSSLVVSGISTLASVTVTSITGNGSGLTGLGTFSGDYNDLSNQPTIPTNNNQLSNGAGYITTSFTNTNQLVNGAEFITYENVGVITATSFSGDGSNLADGRWSIGANGSSDYTFTGIGFTQTTNDPDLYLARGRVYEFENLMGAHGFQIQDTQNGTIGNPYNNGVTNNGTNNGTVRFEVPFNAPDTLYYQCVSHTGMGGTIFIYPTLR